MKPHRQIRTSKRVSSETGVAITDSAPGPTRIQDKLVAMRGILQTCAPAERKHILATLAKEETTRK